MEERGCMKEGEKIRREEVDEKGERKGNERKEG